MNILLNSGKMRAMDPVTMDRKGAGSNIITIQL
jgi:hypothetical protein